MMAEKIAAEKVTTEKTAAEKAAAEKKLAEKLNEIEMPKEMRERIIKNCNRKTEENIMSKNATNQIVKNFWKRPMVAAASLVLCLCLTSVTALAATGQLRGFFRDIIGWNGAVIGTAYEQATDEVDLNVIEVADELTIEVTMLKPKAAPYGYVELFGVESYKIVDMEGKVIVEGETTELAEVADGKVNVKIPLGNIADGEYKLVVSELVGSAKADQPLVISGTWECEFVK